MAVGVVDALGNEWLDYDLDVYHCPRCHRVVRIYDPANADIAAILAFHVQLWDLAS